MEFEVVLEPTDVRAFVAFGQRLAKSGKPNPPSPLWAVAKGVLGGMLVGLVVGAVVTFVPWLDIWSFLIGAVAAVGMVYIITKRAQKKILPREGSPMLGTKKLVMTDEWLRVDADLGTSYVRWSYIQGVYETPKHVFVVIEPLNGIILPRRSFAAAETLATVVEYVKQRIPATAV